jgi:hypothetical protein
MLQCTLTSLRSFNVGWDDYRCGRTRIFFRAGKIGKMQEIQRLNMASGEGKKLISQLKKWLVIQKWKWAKTMIQHMRTSVWLLELIRSKPGMALRIQCAWRRKAAYIKVGRSVGWYCLPACMFVIVRGAALHCYQSNARAHGFPSAVHHVTMLPSIRRPPPACVFFCRWARSTTGSGSSAS